MNYEAEGQSFGLILPFQAPEKSLSSIPIDIGYLPASSYFFDGEKHGIRSFRSCNIHGISPLGQIRSSIRISAKCWLLDNKRKKQTILCIASLCLRAIAFKC